MNLSPYLPPTSGEAGAVMALLQVIADPAAAKKVLEKMIEERKAIENATEKQRELAAESEVAAKQAKADLDQTNAVRVATDRRKLELEANENSLNEKRAAVTRREQALAEREKELTDKARGVAEREGQLAGLEIKLERRETLLTAREKKLAEDVAENEKWLASLKPPRGR